jgi:16S rRNA (adenine1518-N6/adenine1519-N6)-dimethyltransferase
MTLLIQKEVAERIIARDGKEGLLSLSVKVYGVPRLVRTVLPGSFNPPPTVDSAILTVSNISHKKLADVDEKKFFTILHLGFAHKRKQLLPNLAEEYKKELLVEAFETCELNLQCRAEDVPLTKWIELTKALA